ncbi:MAG: tetratricopeptide repeat protein, partial [Planctomycetota bacterium]
AEAALTPLGEHRLRGVREIISLWQALPASLAERRFPPLDTPTARPTNLSPETTPFVGRGDELDSLAGIFERSSARVVTITGPGGMGKTRLARRFGAARLDELPGGVWFVDLSETRSAEGIAHQVLLALGVPPPAGEPPEQAIAGILEFREPLLLILDNFEQVTRHAAGTVGLWSAAARRARFLVTSRERLGLAGEVVHELGPLTLPAGAGDGADLATTIESSESVELFVERARLVKPGFALDASNARAVADICTALDGIPFAIELAAARMRIFTAPQLAARLVNRLDLLRSELQDLSPRHRTLRAAYDWSYGLLDDVEKHAFLQACAFRGGFSLDAAESVIDLSDFEDPPAVVDVIQGLCDKSLVTPTDCELEPRLRIYHPVRQFGSGMRESLLGEEKEEGLRQRLAAHFCAYAEAWDRRVHTADGLEALDRIALETENLFAVHDRAVERRDGETAATVILAHATTLLRRGPHAERVPRLEGTLRLLEAPSERRCAVAIALARALQDSGDWERGIELLDEALDFLPEGAFLRARALYQRGELRRYRSLYEEASSDYAESEAIFRALGEGLRLALAIRGLCAIDWVRGDPQRALASLEDAAALIEETGDLFYLGHVVNLRAHLLKKRGALDEALECYERAAEIARQVGSRKAAATYTGNGGIVLLQKRAYEAAQERFVAAERVQREIGDRNGVARNLCNRAGLLHERGDLEAALACYRESERIYRMLGAARALAIVIGGLAGVHSSKGDTGRALRRYREAEGILRELGDDHTLAIFVFNRGEALKKGGHLEGASRSFAEAEEISRKLDDGAGIARAVGQRGGVLLVQGRPEEARTTILDALRRFDESGGGDPAQLFAVRSFHASVEAALGHDEAAESLAEEALSLAESLGITSDRGDESLREGFTTMLRLRDGGGLVIPGAGAEEPWEADAASAGAG